MDLCHSPIVVSFSRMPSSLTPLLWFMQIPVIEKPKPVPKTTYQAPSDQQIIDQMKTENRRKAKVIHFIGISLFGYTSCLDILPNSY